MKRSLAWMAGLFIVAFAAITLLRSERSEEEAEAASTVEENRVRSFWNTYNQATRERMANDHVRAAVSYRKALEIDPKHQDSLFYLAVCLQESGRYGDAAAVLKELVKLYPEHGRGWSQLGAVLMKTAPGGVADLDAARVAFERSLEINQEHTGPFLRLGALALERGRLEEAKERFGIAADAGAPEGLFYAGLTAYLQSRWEEAAAFFVRVLQTGAREKALTGKGIVSEGDVEGNSPLTALERAHIRSMWFLYWSSRRMGGYPESVPPAFRLDLDLESSKLELASAEPAAEARGAFFDSDRDGRLDLVLASRDGLYLKRALAHGWIDVTEKVGLGGAGAWDTAAFDADGDGWQDLYAVRGGFVASGMNALYVNEEGRFRDVTESWGLGGERSTVRAVAADFDGDGELDLLEVGNARDGAEPVRLYLRHEARFEESAARWTLAYAAHLVDAAVADVDADGKPDVFLLGWKSPGRLFRNTGTRFTDVTEQAGLAGVGGEGYRALFFDYDGDGDPDLLVTAHAELEHSLLRLLGRGEAVAKRTPRLFRNDGSGGFVEVTSEAGLDKSFGVMDAAAADVDGDGRLDLIFAHGGVEASHLESSVILKNRDGETFVEWAHLPSLADPRRSLGVAAADTDGDGRAEVFLSGSGVFRRRR